MNLWAIPSLVVCWPREMAKAPDGIFLVIVEDEATKQSSPISTGATVCESEPIKQFLPILILPKFLICLYLSKIYSSYNNKIISFLQ